MNTCLFEATVPADASFEDVARQFAVNRQFCSWNSFNDRKLVGLTFAYDEDARSGWETLNNSPLVETKVCNVQSMIDAGWNLRPLTVEPSEEKVQPCGGYGIQLYDPLVEPLDETVGSLQELCFREAHKAGDIEVDPFRLWSLGSELHMRWTLPVRYVRYESAGDLLRLWFDDQYGAAWADDRPGHVKAAAKALGVELTEVSCRSR